MNPIQSDPWIKQQHQASRANACVLYLDSLWISIVSKNFALSFLQTLVPDFGSCSNMLPQVAQKAAYFQ